MARYLHDLTPEVPYNSGIDMTKVEPRIKALAQATPAELELAVQQFFDDLPIQAADRYPFIVSTTFLTFPSTTGQPQQHFTAYIVYNLYGP